jgi:glycosyltransferase involved in cell wall biosynthesis
VTALEKVPSSLVYISGSTGIAVPLGDTDALAAALEKLSTSESLRRTYGAAARELVEKRFALNVVSARMASLYGTIMGIKTEALG